jgi:hypothetical protein
MQHYTIDNQLGGDVDSRDGRNTPGMVRFYNVEKDNSSDYIESSITLAVESMNIRVLILQ